MPELIKSPLKYLKSIVLLLSVMLVSACSMMGETDNSDNADMKTLKGEVTFREKNISPKNVTLKVTLFNSSKEKGQRDVVAYMHKLINKSPPYAFELDYDSSKLEENMTYAIDARIEVNGKVVMLPAESTNPFAEGVDPENLVIMVQSVGLNATRKAVKNAEAPTSPTEEPAPVSE